MADFKLDRIKFRWKGSWYTGANYIKDDVVYYAGKAFVCLQEHTSSSSFYTDFESVGTGREDIEITIGDDSLNAQSQGKLYLNAVESPELNLIQGRQYDIIQNDTTNVDPSVNILLLGTITDGELEGGPRYSNGVTYLLDLTEVTEAEYIEGFEAATDRRIRWTVPSTAPDRIYYYSKNNPNMGGIFNTRYDSNWELMLDGFEWYGDWTADTFYPEGAIVKYNGYLYQSTADHLSLTADDGLPGSIVNWKILASGTNWINSWSAGRTYDLGDVVRYNGITYICNERHVGAGSLEDGLEPDQTSWTVINSTDDWTIDWSTDVRYRVNDLVKYGGIIYRCISGHTSTSDPADGLEFDQSKWEIVVDGIEYKGDWLALTRYKKNDIVKVNASLYIAQEGHTAGGSFTDDNPSPLGSGTKWTIWVPGLGYEVLYDLTTNYYKGDIVLYGGYSYIATQPSTGEVPGLDSNFWLLATTGYMHKGEWDSATQYRFGEIVRNSGYLYIAREDNITVYPDSDPTIWQILVTGRQWRAEWNDNREYFLGDVVTYKGTTYICTNRHTSTASDSRPDLDQELLQEDYWSLHIQGDPSSVMRNQGDIIVGLDVNEDSVVEKTALDIGLPGQVLKVDETGLPTWSPYDQMPDVYYVSTQGVDSPNNGRQLSSPFRTVKYACDYVLENGTKEYYVNGVGVDVDDGVQDIWSLEVALTLLATTGSLPQAPQFENFLESINPRTGNPYGDINNTGSITIEDAAEAKRYFGGTTGLDPDVAQAIIDINEYIKQNGVIFASETVTNAIPAATINVVRHIYKNSTIFVKTGLYKEELPITIPANCALVGDELRSTNIQPAEGFETSNMFYVRNGTGIRNMTLEGLRGELGAPNANLTRRPTAGAFVSLDPGTGTDDQDAWITNKSPYVQNVTTFGTACIGMKIDGSLHDGGNDSIVANDFTQVLDDGIGYWATNGGRSELVSVFTYFCHIGYLADEGGILRATNGNNSYGTYGSVAEGFNPNETPISGTIDNRTGEAEFAEAFTYGTEAQQILALGYTHRGQDYSSASISFTGSGNSDIAELHDFRPQALSHIRVLDPGDSSSAGGLNYTRVVNNAQSGSATTITLSQADINDELAYIGQRIIIQSGKGVGQYAEIVGYNNTTKVVNVSRESDGRAGWDHFLPGWPIETSLDETTQYAIEPRIITSEGMFTVNNEPSFGNSDWKYFESTSVGWFAVDEGTGGSVNLLVYLDGGSLASKVVTPAAGKTIGGLALSPDESQLIILARSEGINPTDKIYVYDISGDSSSEVSLGSFDIWTDIAVDTQAGIITILGQNGSIGMSTDNGANWTVLDYKLTTENTTYSWDLLTFAKHKINVSHAYMQNSLQNYVDGETTDLLYDFWDVTLDSGFKRGDLNEDGTVDATDVALHQNYWNNAELTTDYAGIGPNVINRIEAAANAYLDNYKLNPSAWGSNGVGQTKPYFTKGTLVAIDTNQGLIAEIYPAADGGATTVAHMKYHPKLSYMESSSLIPAYTWTDIEWGNDRVMLIGQQTVDSTSGNTPIAYSFDLDTWYIHEIDIGDFTSVAYGNGEFIAVGNTNFVARSRGGDVWTTFGDDSSPYSIDDLDFYTDIGHHDGQFFILRDGIIKSVNASLKPLVRPIVESSRILDFAIYDPGAYLNGTEITVYDNTNTKETNYEVQLQNGVIGYPTLYSRGQGYVTLSATISGNGFADKHQLGVELNVANVTRLPGPGDNLNIEGINEVQYSISQITNITGTGPYAMTLTITPSLDRAESPDHGINFSIRQLYSQVRLTGHDFLDIGTGNVSSTRYPRLYLEGEDAINARQPFNETVAFNGGRVFYTSTDQDGNFRVGELFEVEQASGIVTVNASQFDLSGLTELTLGGIQVGGSAVIIREFSKDPNFTANSNNVVPTQKAIKTFIENRISGGGSNAQTNRLIAGQIDITSNTISTTSDLQMNMPRKMNLKGGIDGDYLAIQYFGWGGARGPDNYDNDY